jgi:hypothetical protein
MAQPTSVAEDPQSVKPEEPTLTFPLGWLMDRAAAPIAYRAYTEVAGLEAPSESSFPLLPMISPTALRLAVTQALDGTWHGSMLKLPKPERVGEIDAIDGIGTIPAVRRLLEYGWNRDCPMLLLARRILFRLLAEDNDPRFLFELAPAATQSETALRSRAILREAAASALAQSGYEADPRLRGAARRVLERVDAFLDSALSDKPWVRVGNQHVLAANAAPPSIYNLTMLAYMPIFRNEHFPETERLYAYLTQPKPTQEAVQLYGKEIVSQPHLVLGDLLHNKNIVDSDVPFALLWLETMARLGFLKRNDSWMKLFERLIEDRDRMGVWHPHKGSKAPSSTNPYVWPIFPLEERLQGEACWTDVTFRIGLIAKLLGWRIDVV